MLATSGNPFEGEYRVCGEVTKRVGEKGGVGVISAHGVIIQMGGEAKLIRRIGLGKIVKH